MLHRGAMLARLLGRALTVMLVAAVLILYAAGANIWLIAAGVALYGVANGMVTILRGIAVADYLGVAGFGRKSGMISAIMGSRWRSHPIWRASCGPAAAMASCSRVSPQRRRPARSPSGRCRRRDRLPSARTPQIGRAHV